MERDWILINPKTTTLALQLRPVRYLGETVVVTATRTLKDLEEVSLPVSVVTAQEIRNSGSMRLSDILQEQTGLQLTSDFGTGVQIQGFDADYTLIMVDGEPLIGRVAGTLDLNRVALQNVRQIEIVKGPSSALWGSDALAGVINIITEEKRDPLAADVSFRYGENQSADAGGTLYVNQGGWSHQLFLNGTRSDGYQLNSTLTGQTVPQFRNGTLRYRSSGSLTEDITSTTSMRMFGEELFSETLLQINETTEVDVRTDDVQQDVSFAQQVEWKPSSRVTAAVNWYFSQFDSESILTQTESGEFFDRLYFRQRYQKPDVQVDVMWRAGHHTTAGGGLILESLSSERYPEEPDVRTQFVYLQHAWLPDPQNASLEIIGGLRLDDHTDYQAQLSPKFSVRYRVSDRLQVRTSVGRGFKAPDFRQLFLDFTNSTAGYTVYGSSTVRDGLQQQIERGLIERVLIPVGQLDEIRAESSWALNSGFDADLPSDVRVRGNVFYNRVTDLIEIAPIALRTTGQSVFTYFNLDEVRTQGGEIDLRAMVSDRWTLYAGYQFLDARRRIVSEKNVQDENGEVIQITEERFEPMFNRSAHSANMRLYYSSTRGWEASIKGSFRGRYGVLDLNTNGYVDAGEYEAASSVWDFSVAKTLFLTEGSSSSAPADAGRYGGISERVGASARQRGLKPFIREIRLRAGIDNVFDFTDIHQPYYAGRLWYIQLQAGF